MDDSIVYLNGHFLPKNEASISVMDRGFLLADAIYEVIPVYDGVPLFVDEHFQRMADNLNTIKIPSPFTLSTLKKTIDSLVKKNKATQVQAIYIQITRGVNPKRVGYAPCIEPTVFMMLQHSSAKIGQALTGKTAITVENNRWAYCNIKGINRLANTLMSEKVYESSADEGIIIDNDNEVLEGIKSNLFIVSNNQLITPKLSQKILNGVTRQTIINLCQSILEVKEESINITQLMQADEILMTGSISGVTPILEVNETSINNANIGKYAKIINREYTAHINKVISQYKS